MWYYVVVLLMGKKGFYFGLCVGFVKMGKVQCVKCIVLILLKWIEFVCWYSIGVMIIVVYDYFGLFDDFVFYSYFN